MRQVLPDPVEGVSAEPAGPARSDHGMRRAAIVEALLKQIVQGELRPGQHLVAQALAKRFGASQTPVREALIALAGTGLVELLPNRGAVVRRVTARDVVEVCQVRRALECEAVRRACGRIDPGALEGLRAELKRLPGAPASAEAADRSRFIQEARAVDSRLHDLVALSSGNSLLANELGRLKTLFRTFRDAAWAYDESRNDYRRLAQEAGEHLAIVEALLAGDRRAAVRAMSRHIRSGIKYWSRALIESVPAARDDRAQPGDDGGRARR